ncbi:phage portal protein family protein [Sorangium sp. So ce1151]|uniref:phage portal protein family protein n=1 Tax=Sorangium sp. So ce1151 TaxID=3133332 RepID=UPI003F5EDD6C
MSLRARIRRAAGEAARQAAELLLEPATPAPASVAEEPRRKKRRSRNLAPLSRTVVEWYQADLAYASQLADNGNLIEVGRLRGALTRDAVVRGLVDTRFGGLVRQPRRCVGHPEVVRWLDGEQGRPGVWNHIYPPAELAQLDADGGICGVGVGEFVQEDGMGLPQLRRLDPQWLVYRRDEDRWQYRSSAGLLDVEPGNGRWVLHRPGGVNEPWKEGIWYSAGRAFIAKEHAINYRENYAGKLAHPARVAVSPQGASEDQSQSWFQSVMAWGVNTVFGMKTGYDVKLLESNGRGHEVFHAIIEHSNLEFMIAFVGQIVTQTGGVGFSNSDTFETMLYNRIESDGIALADTISTQGIEPVVWRYLGASCLSTPTRVEWDTRPPADMAAVAETLTKAAGAIKALREVMAVDGIPLDMRQLLSDFGVPVRGDVDGDAQPDDVAARILETWKRDYGATGALVAARALVSLAERAANDVEASLAAA